MLVSPDATAAYEAGAAFTELKSLESEKLAMLVSPNAIKAYKAGATVTELKNLDSEKLAMLISPEAAAAYETGATFTELKNLESEKLQALISLEAISLYGNGVKFSELALLDLEKIRALTSEGAAWSFRSGSSFDDLTKLDIAALKTLTSEGAEYAYKAGAKFSELKNLESDKLAMLTSPGAIAAYQAGARFWELLNLESAKLTMMVSPGAIAAYQEGIKFDTLDNFDAEQLKSIVSLNDKGIPREDVLGVQVDFQKFGDDLSLKDKLFWNMILLYFKENPELKDGHLSNLINELCHTALNSGIAKDEVIASLKVIIQETGMTPDFLIFLKHKQYKIEEADNQRISHLYHFEQGKDTKLEDNQFSDAERKLFQAAWSTPLFGSMLQLKKTSFLAKEKVKDMMESDNFLIDMKDENKRKSFEELYKIANLDVHGDNKGASYAQIGVLKNIAVLLKTKKLELKEEQKQKISEERKKEIDLTMEDLDILLSAVQEGHCSGLSLLFAAHKLNGNIYDFFDKIRLISEWDGKSTLDPERQKIFEEMMGQVIFAQNFTAKSPSFSGIQNFFEEGSGEIKNIQSDFKFLASVLGAEIEETSLTVAHDQKALIKAMNEIPDDQAVIVSTRTHSMSFYMKTVNGVRSCYFYDPNFSVGEKVLTPTEASRLILTRYVKPDEEPRVIVRSFVKNPAPIEDSDVDAVLKNLQLGDLVSANRKLDRVFAYLMDSEEPGKSKNLSNLRVALEKEISSLKESEDPNLNEIYPPNYNLYLYSMLRIVENIDRYEKGIDNTDKSKNNLQKLKSRAEKLQESFDSNETLQNEDSINPDRKNEQYEYNKLKKMTKQKKDTIDEVEFRAEKKQEKPKL